MAERWEPLDTVYSKKHSKGRQFWVGGNDFTLTTGDKATDNMLKDHAFAVKQGRRLYVNCRNLEFQKTRFGKGYAQAMTMGKDTVFFVNKKIGKDVMERQIAFGSMFGAIGTAVQQRKKNLSLVATDVANFKAQQDTGYKTLYQYLWHLCADEYDQSNG